MPQVAEPEETNHWQHSSKNNNKTKKNIYCKNKEAKKQEAAFLLLKETHLFKRYKQNMLKNIHAVIVFMQSIFETEDSLL